MISHLDSSEAPFSDRAIAVRLHATLAAFGVDPEMFAIACDLDGAKVIRALDADEECLLEVCGAALQRFRISSDWLLFGDVEAMELHPALPKIVAEMPYAGGN